MPRLIHAMVALSLFGCGGATSTTSSPVAEAGSCGAALPAHPPAPLDATRTGATVALAAWGDRTIAYVADEDERALHVVDVQAKKRLGVTQLEGKPSQLIVTEDGRVVVALRDRGELRVYALGDTPEAPLSEACSVPTAAEPVGLALTPDERTLVVSSGWGRAVGGFDGKSLARRFEVALDREPRAITVAGGGKSAFVTHMVGGVVDEIDLKSAQLVRSLALHDEVNAEQGLSEQVAGNVARDQRQRLSSQGFALARSLEPDGRILVPHVLVDPGVQENRTTGYGDEGNTTEIANVAVIDTQTGRPMTSSLDINGIQQLNMFGGRQQVEEPCLLPRAAVVDNASASLLVACVGGDTVVAYDAASANPQIAEKRRWRVPSGPTGIAIDTRHRRALVWAQFDRTLAILPLDGPELVDDEEEEIELARIALPSDPEHAMGVSESLGRLLFHATGDTRIAQDGRACASCHPDGRDDGLTWSTPNGPRRTLLLAGRLEQTAPYSWDGGTKDLDSHVTATFKRLQGVGGLRSVERRALISYLQGMDAPPRLARDAALVARGREVFRSKEGGCATCHSGPHLTDNRDHDVQSKTPADRSGSFNTPTLRFVAQRAPYFHDGRFETLRDLLAETDGSMGHTNHLGAGDLDALEAYLESL